MAACKQQQSGQWTPGFYVWHRFTQKTTEVSTSRVVLDTSLLYCPVLWIFNGTLNPLRWGGSKHCTDLWTDTPLSLRHCFFLWGLFCAIVLVCILHRHSTGSGKIVRSSIFILFRSSVILSLCSLLRRLGVTLSSSTTGIRGVVSIALSDVATSLTGVC